MLKQRRPDIPDGVIDEKFEEILNNKAIEDSLIKAYLKHYTHEEIRQMSAYYENPVWKKTARALVPFMQDMISELMTESPRGKKIIEQFEQDAQMTVDMLKQKRPDIPAIAIDIANERLLALNMEDAEDAEFHITITKIFAQSLHKHCTGEELGKILTFHRSPLGKKMDSINPQIKKEIEKEILDRIKRLKGAGNP